MPTYDPSRGTQPYSDEAYFAALDQQSTAKTAAPAASLQTPSPAPVSAPAPTPAPTPAPVESQPSKAMQIDNMVATLAANGANLSNPVERRATGSVSYNTADDSFQVLAAPTPGSETQPLYDSEGLDLQSQIDREAGDLKALQARLADGKYDSETGQFKPTVTGDARERLEKQFAQAQRSYDYSYQRLNLLAQQRAAAGGNASVDRSNVTRDAHGNETTWEELAAKEAFVSSAPSGKRAEYAETWDRQNQQAKSRAIISAYRKAGGR